MIALVPLAPWTIVKLFGDAESAKLPCGFTVRESVAVLVKLPEVPVMVTVVVPTVAVPEAERVRRLLDAVGFVLKVAVTPAGRPKEAKFTGPLNPLRGLTGMVVEPDAPWRRVKLAGDDESVKLG